MSSPPGGVNRLSYHGRGVTAVISPWNFPLAIPSGMVGRRSRRGQQRRPKAGRTDSGVAAMLVRAFGESGLPEGVLCFLPGSARRSVLTLSAIRRECGLLHRIEERWPRHRRSRGAHERGTKGDPPGRG